MSEKRYWCRWGQGVSQIAAGHLVIIKRVALLTPLCKLSQWKGVFRQGLKTQLDLFVNSPQLSFCKNSIEPDLLRINDSCLERASVFRLLGVWQQDNLCCNYHVEQTFKKASKRLYFLMECRKANLPTEIGITIYCTKIRLLLEYASPLWGGLPKYLT